LRVCAPSRPPLTLASTAPADSLYRIVFQTDGSRVQWIRAGLLPDVFELEGCE
jgi:predicted lipoprotein with Yx(FWY)xxD motif